MTIVLGIDPGITGALATLDGESVYVDDLPIRLKRDVSKVKNEIDPIALKALLLKRLPADRGAICVMEVLNTFAGGSVQTMASLAATKAVISTVLELCGVDTLFVSPQAWQKFYGIRKSESSDTKEQSLAHARKLFGSAFCPLKKHHGRSDALLIARYGQRYFV